MGDFGIHIMEFIQNNIFSSLQIIFTPFFTFPKTTFIHLCGVSQIDRNNVCDTECFIKEKY